MDILATMLRWLTVLLHWTRRPDGSGIETVCSMRPEVPPGRRRLTTTVEEFEAHIARQRAGSKRRS